MTSWNVMPGPSPIIFIGMHRSGTSLLGRLLEQCGLFVGMMKDDNNEALFFRQINEWLLAQCGARWDNPEAVSYLCDEADTEPRRKAEAYISGLLDSPRAALFLGRRRFAGCRSVFGIQGAWGWKDPRNTFTLPFWLALFPRARIVFIERHGVDVTQSLRVRAEKSMATAWRRYEKGRSIMGLRLKRVGSTESPRCLALEGGFSLWESYQSQAKSVLGAIPEAQVFRVRYEELLANPEAIVRDACAFCGLSVSESRVRGVTASINSGRAYAYRDNEELVRFAEAHNQALWASGYQP